MKSAGTMRAALAILLLFAAGSGIHAVPGALSALAAFPDYLAVRSEFLSAVVTAPAATASAFKTAYRDTSSGRVRVSVEREGQNLYVLFLRERDGAYPYGSQGNIIVRRDATTNFIRQIKWVLSDDGLSWVSLTPSNERTIVDYVVGGSVVRSGLSVSSLLYYFFLQPFRHLHDMTRATLDWTLVLGEPGGAGLPRFAADIAASRGSAAALIRASLDFSSVHAYIAASSLKAALPEEETKPAFAQSAVIADGRETARPKAAAWSAERGLPLPAATAVMLSSLADGSVFLGYVDSGDGRYPYKLILLPYRTERGSYALYAFDAEARKALDWGELVRSRSEGYIRLIRLPAP
jgi:hypothetical protein